MLIDNIGKPNHLKHMFGGVRTPLKIVAESKDVTAQPYAIMSTVGKYLLCGIRNSTRRRRRHTPSNEHKATMGVPVNA